MPHPTPASSQRSESRSSSSQPPVESLRLDALTPPGRQWPPEGVRSARSSGEGGVAPSPSSDSTDETLESVRKSVEEDPVQQEAATSNDRTEQWSELSDEGTPTRDRPGKEKRERLGKRRADEDKPDEEGEDPQRWHGKRQRQHGQHRKEPRPAASSPSADVADSRRAASEIGDGSEVGRVLFHLLLYRMAQFVERAEPFLSTPSSDPEAIAFIEQWTNHFDHILEWGRPGCPI